jgi:hypothetical protein
MLMTAGTAEPGRTERRERAELPLARSRAHAWPRSPASPDMGPWLCN